MNKLTVIAFFAGLASSVVGGTFGIIMATTYTEVRTELVFVYDNLTNPIIRMAACHCKTDMKPATLPGYEEGVRTIFASPSSHVSGGLIAVSKEEFARLDSFKDFPNKYRRDRVVIDKLPAWIYIRQ